MFDIGWTEMVVIAILAIIVIGPKDLPKVLRALGGWLRKARVAAREFQSGLDEAMRESGLDDVKKNIDSVADLDPRRAIKNAIDPTGEIGAALRPDQTGPGRPEPGRPEPERPEPGRSEPGRPEPGRSEPGAAPGPASPPGGDGKPRPGK